MEVSTLSRYTAISNRHCPERGKLLYLPSSLNEFTNKYLALPEDDRESFLEEQKHMIGERNKVNYYFNNLCPFSDSRNVACPALWILGARAGEGSWIRITPVETWQAGRVSGFILDLSFAHLISLHDFRIYRIIQKLEKLGWGEDVRGIQSPDFAKHKLVDRPQRLTEKSLWHVSIHRSLS